MSKTMDQLLHSKHNKGPFARSCLDRFGWIIDIICELRPDLKKLFRLDKKISVEFIKWLISSGANEYHLLEEDDELIAALNRPLKIFDLSIVQAAIYLERPDVQKTFHLPQQKDDFKDWFYRHGVNEYNLQSMLDEEGWKKYSSFYPERTRFQACIEPFPNATKPLGVNLIGYAYGQLGIGEDLRMTARALQNARIPFTIIDFPPGKDIPQNDMSMADFVGKDAPYAFNIFCLSALETGRFYAENGPEMFGGHYNIGYWPWELSKWPNDWKQLVELVDEIWVSSRHIYDAVAPISSVPVLIMPLAVDVAGISRLSREDFDLPSDAYLFCFSFDLNSSVHRKNPMACIRAFQKAFPLRSTQEKPVGLVIKSHAPVSPNRKWSKLKELAAEDPRIHIVEKTLQRGDLLALYQCCNCYLSLHRAEGFGRGIAEALLLGLNVIATDYSGNVDFCRGNAAAHLASYNLVPVGEKEYAFADGQYWAEVKEEDVVNLMRNCLNVSEKYGNSIIDYVGLRATGKRYCDRLKMLWKTHNII